jgi:hypothetical protein
MKKFVVATLVALLFLASMSLAQSLAQQSRPNMVFILIDDLRWDELEITGHPFIKTPHLDRIGREGALFRNAFMTTPRCSPQFPDGPIRAHTHTRNHRKRRSIGCESQTHYVSAANAASWLLDAFIGKWHMGNDDTPRPRVDGACFWF